jgi:hypothetical protein
VHPELLEQPSEIPQLLLLAHANGSVSLLVETGLLHGTQGVEERLVDVANLWV